jgi:hypothetical protein
MRLLVKQSAKRISGRNITVRPSFVFFELI